MRVLALAFAAFVFTTSILTSSGYASEILRISGHLPGRDITGHFLLMGLLAFFVVMGFASARPAGRRLGVPGAAFIVAVLVTLDELIQLTIPSRTFSLVDLGASYAGIVSFSLLAAVVMAVRRGRDHPAVIDEARRR